MKRASCDRVWEVEAVRDGRLTGAARADARRHVEGCEVCGADIAYLEALAAGLRAMPSGSDDEVALRRLRGRVLAKADSELAGRAMARPGRTWSVRMLGAGLVAASCVVVALHARPHHEAVPLAAVLVEAADEGGAEWTRAREGNVERIVLRSGTLRLRVQRRPGDPRVVVSVPDGEIEDLGTTFHVTVREGRTQRIAVDEGIVVLRRGPAPEITVAAGSTWVPEAPRPAVAALPAPLPLASPPASVEAPRAPAATTHASTRRSVPVGDGEDAAYLAVVRLLQTGHEAQAKQAARAYLARYPNGFRREEMVQLAR